MEDQYGLLVGVDKNQVQFTKEDPQLNTCLNELHISRKLDFKGDISGIFLNASGRRSNLFMNYNYMNYAKSLKGGKSRIPIYGIKGAVHEVKRATNYTAWYASMEEHMIGTDFFAHIFGTDYITEEETLTLTDPIPRLQKNREVSLMVREEDVDIVCHIAEKLWEALERNAQTRFIVLIDDAETKSMELLREIYLFLPQRLRLQLGFETNIAKADLDMVQSSGGLPIHVFTMEKSEYREIAQTYDFPVVVYDPGNQDSYTYDQKHLSILKQLCRQMGRITLACLSYAEGKVMKENEQWASSFTLYEDIVNKIAAPDFGWWKQGTPEDIGELCARYWEQENLMKEPDVEGEAVRAFYMDLLQKGHYAFELVQMLRNPAYPNREEYLQFMRQNLYYGPQIDATEALIEEMNREKSDALSEADEQSQQKLKQIQVHLTEEKEKAVHLLENQYEKEKEDLKNNLDQQYSAEKKRALAAHKDEIAQYERRISSLQQKNQEISEQLNKLERFPESSVSRDARNVEEHRQKVNKSNIQAPFSVSSAVRDSKEIEELKKKVDKLNKAKRESEDELSSVKKTKNVFIILSCVFAVLTVALGVLFAVSMLRTPKNSAKKPIANDYQAATEAAEQETETIAQQVIGYDQDGVVRQTDEIGTQNGTDTNGQTMNGAGTQNDTDISDQTMGGVGRQSDAGMINQTTGGAGTRNGTNTSGQAMDRTEPQSDAGTINQTTGGDETRNGEDTSNQTLGGVGRQNVTLRGDQMIDGTGTQSDMNINGQTMDGTGMQNGTLTDNLTTDEARTQNDTNAIGQTIGKVGIQNDAGTIGQMFHETEEQTDAGTNMNIGTVTLTRDAQNSLVVEDGGHTYSWR